MNETFGALLAGFGTALAPMNLLWGFVGVTLGTFIGVLPGVGPALTVAISNPAGGETVTSPSRFAPDTV